MVVVVTGSRGGGGSGGGGSGGGGSGGGGDDGEAPAGEESDGGGDAASGDDNPCEGCGLDDDGKNAMFCDGCDRCFHIYCLPRPIFTVPDGDWYCHDCSAKQAITAGWPSPNASTGTAQST